MARRARGFTLVELLVALFALALMAVLSWRGLDGMARAQEQTRVRADEVQVLQTGLAQWGADLDALVELPPSNAIDWNGRVLRLTRSAPGTPTDGVVVVGWSRRIDRGVARWMRWQSPPVTTRGQLDEAWRRADAWAQNNAAIPGASEVAVTGLQDWQVFYYRSDAWTNPLSSDQTQSSTTTPAPGAGATTPPAGTRTATVPDGVRIVLLLPPGQAITGELTRDWVRPTVGGGKSS
ncbi:MULTISPECIES: prepilin-type N-terminal cleavage/methylation domain-containing protein [Ramlibacter]|uniref:Prepilin-type N-terminal cleavage/methylation domain-containing protein n=1 Tax=Ramlibacter pinisoli TaxID=2682844 RepID=A0A6N8IU36_9BURK|nr:prepilin-type N-terminal cleavage/methylation domain-containing protein [Ramlibacter sp. CGMCC 1.13660]MVQ30348.1 prepilin-type N-terminal cleavage/methylation domain-containing protein [Ramlibacter pinisoli]